MGGYKPKIVDGKINETGWPIDGHTLRLTLWDYDNRGSWHLFDWEYSSDEAVMKTMYQTEVEAGICLADTLEEFEEQWKSKEWEPQGSFCIPLDKVEVIAVIREEEQD